MRDTLNEYLEKFKENSKKHKKMISVFFMLALIVAVGVTWRLKLIGVSMTNEVYCGKEEHIHTADCYRIVEATSVTDQDVVIAGVAGHSELDTGSDQEMAEDNMSGIDRMDDNEEIPEGYVKILTCGKEEHAHSILCMSDETADLESEEDWRDLINELNLSGKSYSADMLAIADSQVGYSESVRNFVIHDNEVSKSGITRFGQWYGNPYGNWDAMFVAFCLNHAGVNSEMIPYNSGAGAWVVDLENAALYRNASEYTPVAGDIAFIDSDGDDIADQVGIVREIMYDENDRMSINAISLIQGDVANESDTNESADVNAINEDAAEEKADCVQIVWYLNEAGDDVNSDERAAGNDGITSDNGAVGDDSITSDVSVESDQAADLSSADMVNDKDSDITDIMMQEKESPTGNTKTQMKLSNIIGYVNVPKQKSKLSNEKVNDAASNQQDENELEQQYYSSQVKLYDAPPVASGYKRIFFDLTNGIWWWLTGDGWPYVSVDGGTTWMSMELVEGEEKVFWSDVPSDFSTIVFARGVKSGDGKYGTTSTYTNSDVGSSNCFVVGSSWVTGSSSNGGSWGTYSDVRYPVYYDATMSKLSYSNSGAPSNACLPKYGHDVYFQAWNNESDIQKGKCVLLDEYTSGEHKWKDVYKANLKKEYTYIIFFSSSDGSWPDSYPSSKTVDLTIDWSLRTPCFYGDTSDNIIYNSVPRSGYWDEIYTLRDVEAGKSSLSADINPIENGNFDETLITDGSVFYMNATFYDYYSDYELNGTPRATNDVFNGGSHRAYVNFRQFDQALSDYYENSSVVNTSAIYTGHFQPDIFSGSKFSDIADTMNLYGWSNYSTFMAVNNSNLDISGGTGKYDSAAVGIVDTQLQSGNLTISTNSGGHVMQPHFNRDFITGNNTKNAVIGEVFDNVAFPFVKTKVFAGDGSEDEYYWFDSARTTLQLKKNLNTDSKFGYYLDGAPFLGSSSSSYNDDDRKNWALNVNYMGNNNGASSGGSNDEISRKFGFFPFNNVDGNENGNCASKYNYGFGTKLSFSFKIPENGTVDNTPEGRPIRFRFSGDDDVWIFVDGQLALDLGGGHGQVQGMIDFSGTSTEKYAYISKVKDIDSSNTAYNQGWEEISPVTLQYLYGENKDGNNHGNGDSTTVTEYYNYRRSFNLSGSNTDVHTVTVFYMERGLWESNFSMVFNFPTVKSDPYTLPETGGSGTNMLIYGGIAILLLGYLYYRCVFKQFNGERRKV